MASELLPDPFQLVCNSPAPELSKPGKKSWSELRKAVRDTRKIITSLASSVPSQFVFRKIHTESGPLTRLYFLGVPAKSRENTFLYVDVPNEFTDSIAYLPWKQLLHSFQMMPLSGHMSKQEQLLRERKRLGVFGITYFDFVEKEGKFVFPAHNSMYVCTDNVTSDEALFREVGGTSCYQTCLNPTFCPTNSELVAFVHVSDLSVSHLKSGCQRRLTHVHKGTGNLSDDPVSAGEPSFVIQEEFDRFTGYWWCPRHETNPLTGENTYSILYEEVDESCVEILHTFAPTTDSKQMDMYRYPRAGTDNAESTLKIVEFAVNSDGQISDDAKIKILPTSLKTFFPWMEYLVRADWTPNGDYVHAQLLSRTQDRLALVLIKKECFQCPDDGHELSYLMSNIHVLVDDRSEVWVNVHNLLHFFPQDKVSEITFLWSSERTGFRHLYLIRSSLEHVDDANDMDLDSYTFDEYFKPNILFEVPLTSGDWEVLPKEFFVDEERGLVYFMGLKDRVLESHLYVVSYLGQREPVRLTELGYSHAVSFNADCSMFVTVYSSLETTPRCCVRRLVNCNGQLSSELLGHLIKPSFDIKSINWTSSFDPIKIVDNPTDYQPPKLFDFMTDDGCQLHGMYYEPHNMEPGVKYPTVLFVYGGPQVQLVNNSFKGLKFLRLHTLATQGYAVVLIDGRGSCHRGLKFESHINGCLGNVELEDQVSGLQWLSSHVDFIDLSRVAIHGWSYGGYLSLMGLAQKPDVFKLAIAGAPVVNWQLYDTGYTERYMDLPQNNPTGYHEGSVLFYIDMFPDEENRLLIIHGLLDENVHFHHTNCLINELIRSCKPYRLQVYPNERHGIRNHDASEHYKTMVLSFLQTHL